MADLVNLTIDGKPVTAAPGTLVINAAKQVGIEIPAFCYYDGLTLQAACRMCLVEVEKTPKLQVGCTLPVAEGMVVHTDSPMVHAGPQGHAGISAHQSSARLPGVRQGRRVRTAGHGVPLRRGREPLRRAEACTSTSSSGRRWCSTTSRAASCATAACASAMRAWAWARWASTIAARVSEIAPNSFDHLECDECGMCIDICPVGALTSGTVSLQDAALGDAARRHHLHALLEWLQDHAGRSQRRDHSRQQSRPLRHQRRVPVHQGPLRVRFRAIIRSGCNRRMVRKNGKLEPVSWSEALETVATKFKEVKERGGKFGVIGSNHTTNEENYLSAEVRAPGAGHQQHRSSPHRRRATLLDALSGKDGRAGHHRRSVRSQGVPGGRRAICRSSIRSWRSRSAPITAITRRTSIR